MDKNDKHKNDFDTKDNIDITEYSDLSTKCKEEECIVPKEHFSPKKTPVKSNGFTLKTSPLDTASPRTRIQSIATDQCKTENSDNIKQGNDNAESSYISIRKMEDLCATPKKTIAQYDTVGMESYKIFNNSQNDSPKDASNANTTSPHLTPVKIQQRTPMSSKKKRRQLSNDRMQEHSPRKLKKRKLSNASDFDQLSDNIKLELSEAVMSNGEEAIDLLHDLDTVMYFEDIKDTEDTKVSTDVLLHSIINEAAKDNDQADSEMSIDPATDPLFIGVNDEDEGVKESQSRILTRSRSRNRTQKNVNDCMEQAPKKSTTKKQSKQKKNKKKANTDDEEMYDTLADIMYDTDNSSEHSEDSDNEYRNVNKHCTNNSEMSNLLSERMNVLQLYNLEVQLIHKVPPQHKVEHTAGSKTPTPRENKLIEKFGPLKKGVYTPAEDEIIMNNWKTFCKKHYWDPTDVKPFIQMKRKNRYYIRKFEERQKFVQFLANGLPWRSLCSVYHRFRKLHEKCKRNLSRYTRFEDEQILSYINKKSKKETYAELGKKLGRSKHSVWLRCQLLKKTQSSSRSLSKVEWTIPLITNFIKCLLKVTLSEDIGELKDAAIPTAVWEKVGKKMNVDHELLKTFWLQQLHMQLFCRSPIYLNDIKIMLIEYMYGKGISNTREIIWPNVAKYFEGVTTIFLCKMFFLLAREITQKTGLIDIPRIIEYLYTEKIREIRNEPTDKYLPRLSYNNGKVKIIDEDTSN